MYIMHSLHCIFQCDFSELKLDTDHVFDLIKHDVKYKQLLPKLTHEDAMLAVIEAFNFLYSAPGPKEEGGQLDLTPEGCMVVSLINQLLIRLIIKRLINLMPAEAIILNQNKIPRSYLYHYLNNQAHFSLKKTIDNYYKRIQK